MMRLAEFPKGSVLFGRQIHKLALHPAVRLQAWSLSAALEVFQTLPAMPEKGKKTPLAVAQPSSVSFWGSVAEFTPVCWPEPFLNNAEEVFALGVSMLPVNI